MDVNENQKVAFSEKVKAFYANDIKGKKFAVWGLAFKPNTDDMREAPSQYIVKTLTDEGAACHVFDPKAMESAMPVFSNNPNVKFGKNQYEVLEGAQMALFSSLNGCPSGSLILKDERSDEGPRSFSMEEISTILKQWQDTVSAMSA